MLSASEHVLGVGDIAIFELVVAGNHRNRQPASPPVALGFVSGKYWLDTRFQRFALQPKYSRPD